MRALRATYTRTSDGKCRRLCLGSYPAVSLDEARVEARQHFATVARGGESASLELSSPSAPQLQENLPPRLIRRVNCRWLRGPATTES
jgi:hypothetical protein